jgi:hypothetical protein
MAKTVRDSKLESRAARERLPKRGKPYYRALDQGLHLGYRRNESGGKWVVRRYVGGGKYVVEVLATADDRLDAPEKMTPKQITAANSETVLNYSQAQAKARSLFGSASEDKAATPLTVRQAVEEYLSWLKQHGGSEKHARNRVENDILPSLGDLVVNALTLDHIEKWQKGLAERPRHVRGKKGGKARELKSPTGMEEARRRRRSTTNRTLTVLKAALNRAFRNHKSGVTSDKAWRTARPYKKADAARMRYLDRDEIKRLINASSGDFKLLLNAALLTGCRYGELTRLQVGDFDSNAGTVFIQESKSGKPRHLVLTLATMALNGVRLIN